MMAFLDPSIYGKLHWHDPSDPDPAWTSVSPVFVLPEHLELSNLSVPVFGCPSDFVPKGATSYLANLGISTEVLKPSATIEQISQKGAFVNGRVVFAAEFTDGSSNTVLFSERVVGDRRANAYDPFRDFFAIGVNVRGTPGIAKQCQVAATLSPQSEFSFGGGSWMLGGWLNTWYNHVLAPNSTIPDCGFGPCCVDGGPVVVTARSFHAGGVNALMADGSVKFVSNVIDATVWNAIGTRNGTEQAEF